MESEVLECSLIDTEVALFVMPPKRGTITTIGLSKYELFPDTIAIISNTIRCPNQALDL